MIQLLFRRAARALAGSGSGLIVVIGIIDIIFGLLVIFNVGASSTFFIFMFAAWFIVSSVIGLMTISKQSRLKGLSIIVNVLGLLLGIILLFNPMMGMILVSTMYSHQAFAMKWCDLRYLTDLEEHDELDSHVGS